MSHFTCLNCVANSLNTFTNSTKSNASNSSSKHSLADTGPCYFLPADRSANDICRGVKCGSANGGGNPPSDSSVVICHINRIIQAIGKEVMLRQIFLIFQENIGIIRIQKPTGLRIVVSAVQIVKPCLGIIVIPAIQERIQLADGIRFAAGCSKRLAPCVIAVFYNGAEVAVNDSGHVTLGVFRVIIGGILVGKAYSGPVAVIMCFPSACSPGWAI